MKFSTVKKISLISAVVLLSLRLCCCSFGPYQLLFWEESQESRTKELKVLSEEKDDDIPSVDGLGTSGIYSFLVVTDVHYGACKSSSVERNDDSYFARLSETFSNKDESLIPRFIVCLGDIANSGFSEEYDQYNEVIEKIRKIAASNAGITNFPSYSILGNHDSYHNGWENFSKQVYPYTSSYVFSLDADNDGSGFSFYFLDSAEGSLGGNQLKNLTKAMAEDKNYKVVFCHYPLFPDSESPVFRFQNTYERNELLSLYAKSNVKYVLAGHIHKSRIENWGNFTEQSLRSQLYQDDYSIVTVNEIAGTVSVNTVHYGQE